MLNSCLNEILLLTSGGVLFSRTALGYLLNRIIKSDKTYVADAKIYIRSIGMYSVQVMVLFKSQFHQKHWLLAAKPKQLFNAILTR